MWEPWPFRSMINPYQKLLNFPLLWRRIIKRGYPNYFFSENRLKCGVSQKDDFPTHENLSCCKLLWESSKLATYRSQRSPVLPGSYGNWIREVIPKSMAQEFRLVKYDHLPRSCINASSIPWKTIRSPEGINNYSMNSPLRFQ